MSEFLQSTVDRTSVTQALEPEALGSHIISTYRYPELGYRTEVVAPDDMRVPEAIQIEAECMAAIGDPIEEVLAEFPPYHDRSLFFLAFNLDAKGTPEDIQAMGRILPNHPTRGNKSLSDLADIVGWHVEGTTQRQAVVNGKEVTVHEPESIVEAFQAESGCQDMDKVWDLATLAPNFRKHEEWQREGVKPGKVTIPIINGFTQEVICAWKRGEVTHLTSMNFVEAHNFFAKDLEFPFRNLFGLKPLKYDNNGTGEGMEAQPAWMDVADLALEVEQRQKRYFAALALSRCAEVSPVDQIIAPQ